MGVLVSAILPVTLVALCGIWLGRKFTLDLPTLSQLNIYVLLPALVLTGLTDSTLEASSAVGIISGFLLNCLLLYWIARACASGLGLPLERRQSLVATTLLANCGNLGLPFLLFSLGEAGLARGLVYLIASAIFVASIGPTLLQGQGVYKGMQVTLRLPVFWATIAGMMLQSISLPEALARAIELLSGAAIPTALLTLGIQLARTPLAFGRYELLAACLRLVISPLTAYGISRLLGLSGLDLQVLVLQSAMPVAVTTLIWVSELGGDTLRVANTIVLSTLLSFISLPLVLWLLTALAG